jgi:Ni,Fe-hydrogenase I large subunit
VPLLDGAQYAAWLPGLAAALDADPGWTRHPTWQGAPAETGALARLQAHPLPAALMRRSGSRVTARFVARLLELALLLTGRSRAAVGALPLPGGGGLAWVENARGLLVHQVRLEAGRIGRVGPYRIVAPTEWNFHPDGALALALVGAPADDRDTLTQRTRRLVDSLDPCVSCEIGFDDA